MCLLTQLQQTWTLVLKLPMCTVRKSVLIWSLYFSSSSKNAKKKVWFSSVNCAYVHAPLLLQVCYRLVHWRYYNAGESGRREHGKARQQCIILMTPREPREQTRRTGDEKGPVTLAQKCLRYKNNKKRTLQYLGHMEKLCWLLWEEHSTSLLPSLLSSRTPLKNVRPITYVFKQQRKKH